MAKCKLCHIEEESTAEGLCDACFSDKMKNISNRVKADIKYVRLEQERAKDYGGPKPCHIAMGLAITAIVRQAASHNAESINGNMMVDIDYLNIGPEHAALIMVAIKIVREAYKHKDDNIDDAIVYLEFARRFGK